MLECYFCGLEIEPQAAVDAGWEPSFYAHPGDGSYSIDGPCCHECAAARLTEGEDGELEMAEPFTPSATLPPTL